MTKRGSPLEHRSRRWRCSGCYLHQHRLLPWRITCHASCSVTGHAFRGVAKVAGMSSAVGRTRASCVAIPRGRAVVFPYGPSRPLSSSRDMPWRVVTAKRRMSRARQRSRPFLPRFLTRGAHARVPDRQPPANAGAFLLACLAHPTHHLIGRLRSSSWRTLTRPSLPHFQPPTAASRVASMPRKIGPDRQAKLDRMHKRECPAAQGNIEFVPCMKCLDIEARENARRISDAMP